MSKPLAPEKAEQLTERLKDLSRKADDAGQDAAGEILRSSLPFEAHPSVPAGSRVMAPKMADVPLPNNDWAHVSYDPARPNDFGFTVTDPTGEPKSVAGVPGMENGETQTTLKPLQVGPAIETAGGISKVQFAARLNIPSAPGHAAKL